MKTYRYSVSTSILWTSFDYGTVEAETIEDARVKALKELTTKFGMANAALQFIGERIDFNADAIEIELEQ